MTRFQDLIARTYHLPQFNGMDCTLDRVAQYNGPDRWAIRRGACCLNHDGNWEYEPLPSSRTDEFFARCRFATADEALAAWDRLLEVLS